MIKIFAYGSNLNNYDFASYCKNNFQITNYELRRLGLGKLFGYNLSWSHFSKRRDCGVLNIIEEENKEVWGVVFEVTDEQLAILDKKEGHPNVYKREKVTVIDENENQILAEAYIADLCVETLQFFPNTDYLNIVVEGMKMQNLPEEYILDFIDKSPIQIIEAIGNCKKKTAIYSGYGVGGKTIKIWQNLFQKFDLGSLEILYSHIFTLEKLKTYDLVILPGGGGLRISYGLGDFGKLQIREYLLAGGAVLGVCAGAYASSHQVRCYAGISPIKIVDYKNCMRGEATIPIQLTNLGKQVFNYDSDELIPIIYHNGPIVYEVPIKNATNFEVLAYFRDEIVKEGGEPNLMINSPAAWKNKYGLGTVFGISPHIERTPKWEFLIANLIKTVVI